jgi:hypothetical protein
MFARYTRLICRFTTAVSLRTSVVYAEGRAELQLATTASCSGLFQPKDQTDHAKSPTLPLANSWATLKRPKSDEKRAEDRQAETQTTTGGNRHRALNGDLLESPRMDLTPMMELERWRPANRQQNFAHRDWSTARQIRTGPQVPDWPAARSAKATGKP